ncbi:MAG: M28 family peptidase [Geothrix sp.]|uniref:M28 family peptidase n=1 Tax=Geothrix sp. TaxID=1962974 RepID=UPI003BAFBE5E
MNLLQRPLATLLLLGLITAGVVLLQAPPEPVPASAPADRFSAERAMLQVRELARAPHPLGTPEHDRVRDHLVGAFRQLGFVTTVQKRVARRLERGQDLVMATVENIVAEKPGSASTGTLLLVAHYDSHGTGPGAGDDAAGVAALLETARALTPGRNTLRILITDGEEVGLLGAQAHVDAIGEKVPTLALNFEARGGGGPVFMFETSEGNLPLLRAFAVAAPRPHASSLMYALYRLLPNDTDLTVLKQAGMAGLNFAFVGRWQHYHTALDTPDGLDRGSLQQHGDMALALGRHFLAADLGALTRPGQGEAIYFDLLGRVLLLYPATLAWPLTGLALGAFAALLWRLRREPGMSKGFLVGMGLALGSLALGALVGQALGLVVTPFREGIPNRDPYGVRWFEAALLATALAALAAVWGWALRRFEGRGLALGALLWWLLALVIATAFLPGATYLLLWPLLFAMLGLWWEQPWVAALPLLLLFPPVWHNLALLLGFSLPIFLGLLVAFGLLPLLPLLRRLFQTRLWTLPLAGLGAALLCFAVGATRTGPRLSTLAYLEDADSGKAQWVSFHAPDAWTRLVMAVPTREIRFGGRHAFASPAPSPRLAGPQAILVGPQLTLCPPERALAVVLTADGPFTGLSLDGKPLPAFRRLQWFAPPASLTFGLAPQAGSRLTVEVILPGLPPGTPSRPAGLIPAPVDPYTDTRVIRRVLVF